MGSIAKQAKAQYPRRTQRKKETRKRIVASTIRLVAEHGSDSVTLAMVAADADIHVTTMFTHFASKAELFLGLSEPAIEALRRKIEAAKTHQPFFEFMEAAQIEFAEMLDSGGDEVVANALYLRTQVDLLPAWLEYEKAQAKMFADYIEEDLGISAQQARLVAGMIVSANIHSFDAWLNDPGKFDLKASTLSNLSEIKAIVSKGLLQQETN